MKKTVGMRLKKMNNDLELTHSKIVMMRLNLLKLFYHYGLIQPHHNY